MEYWSTEKKIQTFLDHYSITPILQNQLEMKGIAMDYLLLAYRFNHDEGK